MQQAVKTGKVAAGVNDNGLLNYFVSQNPDVEVTSEFKTNESYGFSVKKDSNTALLRISNDAIASDQYDKVYKKWFGKGPPRDRASPSPANATEGDLSHGEPTPACREVALRPVRRSRARSRGDPSAR